MSSSDSGQEAGGSRKPAAKKRRTNLACDMCKKRKIRCDGKHDSGKCTNCREYGWTCTYDNAVKKYPPGYVMALQTKVEKLEALLRELHPDEDFTARVGVTLTRTNWMQKGVLGEPVPKKPSPFVGGSSKVTVVSPPPAVAQSPGAPVASTSSPHPLLSGNSVASSTDFVNDEEDIVVKLNKLSEKLKQTHIGNFYGRSSNKALIMNALALDKELGSVPNIQDAPGELIEILRPKFWEEQPWEYRLKEATVRPYKFPDPDLLEHLVDLYFVNIHISLPILHQPTFRLNLKKQLHLSSREFGAVVLLVCANAARYSDDPRVLLPGSDNQHSAGYEWFVQVQFAFTITPMADVELLQTFALGVPYLMGKSEITAWNICGAAIRLAQNLGIHRKPAYDSEPTLKDELFKRSFWTLIFFDRYMSSSLGRACAIVDDDLDLDFPVDCDDEYWTPTNGSPPFKQPDGLPSHTSMFIWSLKLSQILGSALRTLHASNKTKAHHGFAGPEWEHRAIAFYDSALNQWLESLPEYLRWDTSRTVDDPVLYQQAAAITARFYEMQIIIHRPFIASEQESELPSLAVCSNAARSCARVLQTLNQHFPGRAPQLYTCAFTSGAVLLFNIGSARRIRAPINPEDFVAVQTCMGYLKSLEDRYQSAGRVWDALNMIVSLGRAPLTEQYLRGQKRQRDMEQEISGQDPTPSTNHDLWTQMTGSVSTAATHAGNWEENGLLSLADAATIGSFAQDTDMSWLSQLNQSGLSEGFDLSGLLGSTPMQGRQQGDNVESSWPFGLESDLLGGGMNPSHIVGDPFAEADISMFAPAFTSAHDHAGDDTPGASRC
ncbi:unnamed protein product [Peniophora sp. CBMAI 1063]|nr:unnamed protein product [Peniophora sp. CBMAI 1063]